MTLPDATIPEVDVLVVGLGPGGCAAALAARDKGLSTLAIDGRGSQATRSQVVLVRPGAQAALRELRLPDITEGRRTTTIRHVENRLREAVTTAALPSAGDPGPASPAGAALALHWHTSVVRLASGDGHVLATLRDETTGSERDVRARHVVDASGGRLESTGRPARGPAGPSHLIAIAEYATPPWFPGVVGVRDAETREIVILFPTWGRHGIIMYLDTPPGRLVDRAVLVARFEAIAARLDLGTPRQAVDAIDVVQRTLKAAASDRVMAIGDSAGTVDIVLGAGMSAAIEDGVEAAQGVAAAQRNPSPRDGHEAFCRAGRRIVERHRSWARRGRFMLRFRPILERLWPTASLDAVERDSVGLPPLLWPAVRFVFGRRPQSS